MILPTKHITQSRSLLGIGGYILQLLDEPKTVSRLWEDFKEKINNEIIKNNSKPSYFSISYDWFILALDFLYSIKSISLENGKIRKLEK